MKPKVFNSICRAASLALPVISACLFASGCSRENTATVAQGVIYSAAYTMGPDGNIHGFTRANQASAVPWGNGSWNVDAYGKLNSNFLIITRPQRPDFWQI